MDDLAKIVQVLQGLGVSGVLIVMFYGLMKGWLVTGVEHGRLATQFVAQQQQLLGQSADMREMRVEIQRLRDRDEKQQDEINDLGKLKAEVTADNLILRARVRELEGLLATRAASNKGP